MKIKLLLLLLPLLVSMKVVIATPLTATITGQNNPLCNGGFGSATVTASGGTAPYTYSWAPAGGNGSTATGLTAGSYTVTVTDAASNTATATVTLTQPTQITAVSTSSADVSCFGGNNGDIYESVSGGTPPYTYLWSPSGNTSLMATGLSAGIYTLTITDNNGCTGTAVATITQPSQLVSTSAMVPNTTCVSPNGSASVTVTGGTPPYKYSWSPVAGTTYSITGLNAGTYVCTITDGNNCADTISVTVTGVVGPALTLTPIADTNVCNGAVIATVIGGTPPYTYLWTPGGQTTATITGLCDGNYCCTVTDANGCTDYSCAVVNTICNNSLAITNTPATCGNNGSATANASGGVPPYTYLWYPGGQTTATITGLSGGSYSVVVHDQSPCYDSGAVSVSSATVSYTVSGNPTSIITGDSTLLIASCNAAATFSWAPPLTVASPTSDSTYATPAVTTEYTVTITTACGSFTDSVLITVNCFNLTMTSTSSFCTSGTATAAPSGGTTPYTYLWAPGGQTTNSISSLSAGTYSVTVTDSSGCSVTDSVTIGNDSLMYSATASPATIIMGDSTYLSSTCTAPATYSWAPAANVTNPNSASSYAAPPVTTEYTVTITTACGTFTDSVLITVNCFNLTMTSTSSFCTSGTATAAPSGGTTPYTYLWAPGGQTTNSISSLSAGTYSVTVTDSSGCSVTDSVTIGNDSLMYSATASPATIIMGDSTYLSSTCTAPATYSWAPAANVTNPNSASSYAAPPVTTEYTVTITTACGTFTDSVLVTVNCFSVTTTSTSSYCSSLSGTSMATATLGIPPYTYLWTPGGETTASVSGLSAGIYTVTVTDSAGCSVTSSANIGSDSVVYSATGNPLYITAGDSTLLTATCNVSAVYSWAPSASVTNPTSSSTYAHPATNTVYTVTITTPCGTYTDTVDINIQCFPLAMSSTPSYYSCTSSYDGTATVTPSGGTPPYTYLWNPGGQTTATITGLTPGTYSVIVHDNTGCSATASVGVSSAAVSLTVSAFPATITMGDSSYLSSSIPVAATYLWAPATGLSCTTCANPMASPTVTTTYTLTATDTCGVLTDSVTVYVANCTNNFNEPICIVTVDTLNGKAMVIWGRTNSPPQGGYGSYIVYRENPSSVFVPIESQPLNVLSEYVDTGAAPSLGPVSYKLATDDSCGESALSAVNTTIYLTVTAGVNVNILNWTPYVGFAPSKYRIFRGPSLTSLVQIDSVPNTVLTYHDTLPPGGSLYVVEAVNPSSTCIPTASIRQHSASVHMLSGSFSNGSVKTETAVQPVSDENIHLNIFPNPSNGSITVQWSVVSGQSSVGCISVINELGQVVYSENKYMNSGSNSEQINLENLASGIYSLRMQTNNSITVKKLVVMRKS